MGGPVHDKKTSIQFREYMTIPVDGTQIALEWECPVPTTPTEASTTADTTTTEQQILYGPIRQPVVLVLHGLNNDADFGYVRSMMRTCISRGWIAVGMNLRGCGGNVTLQTPRGYNGAYTGDIRYVVESIVSRFDHDNSNKNNNQAATSTNYCLFLVGNSLGANLITKYLGEEGLSGSLPSQVAGGVALGNPLVMNSSRVSPIWSPLMALGAKKTMLENWSSLKQSNDLSVRKAIKNALCAVTLKDFDEAMAPIYARNNRYYPFNFLIGFENAEEYGNDAASYKVVRHVPVPLLTLAAKDDMIVYHPSRTRLAYCLSNPNVMWVETMCGGHLGWQESPPEKGNWWSTTSWADAAAADFIEATLKARNCGRSRPNTQDSQDMFANTIHIKEKEGFSELPYLQSKL
jgi:predicted alpha/beta-fold hydrolase